MRILRPEIDRGNVREVRLGFLGEILPKLVGRWPFGMQLVEEGILVLARPRYLVPFGQIAAQVEYRRSFWFHGLILRPKGKPEIRLRGIERREGEAFAENSNQAWRHHFLKSLEENAEELTRALRSIKRLDSGLLYSAACVTAPILEVSKGLLSDLPDELPHGIGTEEQRNQIEVLSGFCSDPEGSRDRFIEKYVQAELEKMRSFFDKIESNPLTPEQRLAVVTDEDATLVLAGAGSGKTSVIVAKAAHLIKSGTRQPDEILLMAFGRDAAAEMATRIEERTGSKVDALTFHALGNSIIRQAENGAPALAAHASDDKAFAAHLREILFSDIASEPKLSALLLKWFSEFYWPYKSEWDFKTKDEYYQYVEAHELRTFQGELVKSFEEWEIANWLYLNGIAYEYEPSYEHDLPENTRTTYTPDFRLTESGVYIEHFGVRKSQDSGGQTILTTAPHVDRKPYLEGMEWKRNVHAEHETALVETFSYERVEGRLTEALEEKLGFSV